MSCRLLPLLVAPALLALAPPAAGPEAPLLRAVLLAAWLCTGWLLLVALLERSSQLPGRAGRLAERSVRRIAPAPVRALVRVMVGAGVAASVLAAPAAQAEDRTPTVAGSSSDALDWPGLAPATARPVPAAAPVVVTVRPGDSLWSIARHALGPGATDRQVAQAWPAWWAANRSVVGNHPDLIHPGDRLSAP